MNKISSKVGTICLWAAFILSAMFFCYMVVFEFIGW